MHIFCNTCTHIVTVLCSSVIADFNPFHAGYLFNSFLPNFFTPPGVLCYTLRSKFVIDGLSGCASDHGHDTLWGYAICTAMFMEVRVMIAWCYGVKMCFVGVTFWG